MNQRNLQRRKRKINQRKLQHIRNGSRSGPKMANPKVKTMMTKHSIGVIYVIISKLLIVPLITFTVLYIPPQGMSQ